MSRTIWLLQDLGNHMTQRSRVHCNIPRVQCICQLMTYWPKTDMNEGAGMTGHILLIVQLANTCYMHVPSSNGQFRKSSGVFWWGAKFSPVRKPTPNTCVGYQTNFVVSFEIRCECLRGKLCWTDRISSNILMVRIPIMILLKTQHFELIGDLRNCNWLH